MDVVVVQAYTLTFDCSQVSTTMNVECDWMSDLDTLRACVLQLFDSQKGSHHSPQPSSHHGKSRRNFFLNGSFRCICYHILFDLETTSSVWFILERECRRSRPRACAPGQRCHSVQGLQPRFVQSPLPRFILLY